MSVQAFRDMREKQVCSLELSKKMKTAGFPQDKAIFVWTNFAPDAKKPEDEIWELNESCCGVTTIDCVAPTSAELGMILPSWVWVRKNKNGSWQGWKFHPEFVHPEKVKEWVSCIEAEVKGMMFLSLIEETGQQPKELKW